MRTVDTALQTLIDVLEQSRSCVVLGAGASVPLVPLGEQFGRCVRHRLLSCGSFPAVPTRRDAIADRILGPRARHFPMWDTSAQIEEELAAEHLSPAAVQAAAIALLWPQPYEQAPPQYEVFNRATHQLGLVNYNNDGLANEHCGRHTIVNVHGTSLSADAREKLDWEWWIDALQDFHPLAAPAVPGLFLPQRESFALASSPIYAQARTLLWRARRLALIGYSFGDGDDVVAYACVLRVLTEHLIPAVVVKPNARELAGQIAEEARSKFISGLPRYWDTLACAILASQSRPRHRNCDHSRLCARCISYLYEAFLDSGRDWIALSRRLHLTTPLRFDACARSR